jgi:hypothetical protein
MRCRYGQKANVKEILRQSDGVEPPGVVGLQEGQNGPERDSVEPQHVGPTPTYSTN